MTNDELNEAIARLMGWEPCLGMVSDWKHPPSQTSMALPDFLARERRAELMDLADKVMGHWDVGTRGFKATAGLLSMPESAEAADHLHRSLQATRRVVACTH